MINFKKKLEATNVKLKTNPIELYDTLDRKSVTGPLRPAQQEILEKWYNNYRRKRDTIIKLHTGEGKTLVGLLILLSSLNSNEGPCLYVCPNIYLVKQVCEEAEKFGIPYCKVTEEGIPAEFENNKSILILHAQKIFNGLSIFGVERRCVEVGAIVLDDSHACIDVIKNAFTVNIFREDNENLYLRILDLFEDEIQNVLYGLAGITDDTELEELPLDALRLDQKILPENRLLKNEEITRVLRYYNFIDNLFSEMDRDGTGDFDLIASEIEVVYKKLDTGQLSQDEIVDQLAEWIKNKSGVGNRNMRACHIVVAYFIQNCEVFREIPK